MKVEITNTIKYLYAIVLLACPIISFSQQIKYKEGKCLTGDCENGYGTFEFASPKATYQGHFVNGSCEDEKATYENENYKYVGGYKNNKQNGKATITFIKGNRAGDTFVGEIVNNKFLKGTYTYNEQHPERKQYIGEFTNNNNKFNGNGTLTYKDGKIQEGQWKDDEFLGTKIGIYQEQDVLKKGDTIVTFNNKYLLSRQTKSNGNDESYGFLYPYGEFYFVHKTIEESNKSLTLSDLQTGKNRTFITQNVIGFITQESANQYKFHEIDCNKTIYDKFNKFCESEICRMENSANVFKLSYSDYEKMIADDTALNNKIATNKLADIVVQITADSDFGILGKIEKAVKGKNESAEKVIEALTKQGIDVNTSLQDKLRDDGIALLLSPVKDNEAIKMAQLFASCNQSIKGSIQNIVSGESRETIGDKTIAEFVKELYRSKDYNSMETDIAKKIKIYRDAVFGTFENCLPQDLQQDLKKNWLYYIAYNALKNTPEAGEATGLFIANQVIKFKLAPEYKEEIKNHITKCLNKKAFIEQYRNEYKELIEKNPNNCLVYVQAINKLKTEVFNPSVQPYEQEVLVRMQNFVFGNGVIPQCKVLSLAELKPVTSNTQSQQVINKNEEIIGYYDKNPVYKKHDSIIINNDIYNLLFQPKQNSFDSKLIRYFLVYQGSNRNMKFENGKLAGYTQKEFVGWVNYDVFKDTYKFEQYTNDQSIPGFNFFGSIYIGDNNPKNANGTPNFDIPSQDKIDNGAKQHDICYDNSGIKGATGVFGREGGHCDHDFAALCLKELNLLDIAAFSTSSLPKHTVIIAGLADYYKGDGVLLSNEVFKPRDTRDRAILVMELFSLTSTKKAYQKTTEEVFEKQLIDNKVSYRITKNVTLTSTSGEQFEVSEGDTFEGEMKDGKIIQGRLYDKNGEMKKIFILKSNH